MGFNILINSTDESTIIKSIESLAVDLIVNKAIKINDSIYSLIDIEVYYWNKKHPDDYTRGVEHNRKQGELEVHRYGIDISLGNKKDEDFGGILICGLYDVKNKKVIGKSLISRTLFNSLTIGDNTIELVTHENKWTEVFKSKRLHLGAANNENKEKYLDSYYKFLAKETSLFKNQKYKDKEKIFRNSDLNETEDLLGYNITR